jgi:hypothetical protein
MVGLIALENSFSSHTIEFISFETVRKQIVASPIMSADSMSDVEIIDINEDIVADYTPIVVKRGIKTFWRVEDKDVCVKIIKARLKVFICVLQTDIIGTEWFQVGFRM